jgi:hypothetical protein
MFRSFRDHAGADGSSSLPRGRIEAGQLLKIAL